MLDCCCRRRLTPRCGRAVCYSAPQQTLNSTFTCFQGNSWLWLFAPPCCEKSLVLKQQANVILYLIQCVFNFSSDLHHIARFILKLKVTEGLARISCPRMDPRMALSCYSPPRVEPPGAVVPGCVLMIKRGGVFQSLYPRFYRLLARWVYPPPHSRSELIPPSAIRTTRSYCAFKRPW